MSINILLDKAHEPDAALIHGALGPVAPFYVELIALTATCAQDWRHYGKKYGWKLKVHAADKNLFELTVAEGWFLVAMALREKEREALKGDPALAGIVEAGADFPEGYSVKIEVRDQAACARATRLVRFVMGMRSLG